MTQREPKIAFTFHLTYNFVLMENKIVSKISVRQELGLGQRFYVKYLYLLVIVNEY